MSSITVYCSSSTHLDEAYHTAARTLGLLLAERGLTLVYGGGGIGLMGELARATAEAGGSVHGIITRSLYDREQGNDACDELVFVETMRERKKLMMERGDAYLALPGGLGTLEEILEVLTARVVGEHRKPIGLVNTGGYYDPLLRFFSHAVEHLFVKQAAINLVSIGRDPATVLDAMAVDPVLPIDDDRVLPMGRS